MKEPSRFSVDPFTALFIGVPLAVLVMLGACAFTAQFYPLVAMLGGGMVLVGLGAIMRHLGSDGRCLGTMSIVSGILLVIAAVLAWVALR